jgi:hypothetical protein
MRNRTRRTAKQQTKKHGESMEKHQTTNNVNLTNVNLNNKTEIEKRG